MNSQPLWAPSRARWLPFLSSGVVSVGLFVGLDGAPQAVYVATALFAAAGSVAGLWLNRPPLRKPWALVAAGLGLWAVGEVVWLLSYSSQSAVAFPSPADAFYLAGYVALSAGVLWLTRARNFGSVLDAIVLTAGIAGAVGFALFDPVFRSDSGGGFERAVALAYPLADIVLCVPLIRVVLSRSPVTATRLLAAAVVYLLVADTVYAQEVLINAYAAGGLLDGLWMLVYVLLGTSMLHPSMALVGRERETAAPLTSARLVGLLGALMAVVISAQLQHGTVAVDSHTFIVGMILVLGARLVGPVRALARSATTDELTGLANRAQVLLRIRESVSALKVAPGRVSVIFCDLDHFKLVNDSFGHAAGDELLRGVASRLRGAVRDGDVIGRTGGDEFAVVVSGAYDSVVRLLAARLSASLSEPIDVSGTAVYPTLSMGVATTEDWTASSDDLLRDADAATYVAKDRGRARVELFTPELHREARDRLTIAAELRRAIPDGELFAVFQPEVHLGSADLFGFEALVRWNHPRRGTVAPGRFIPVAEASGLVGGVFDAVLADSIAAQCLWREQLGFVPVVSVNLSPRQLGDRTLPASILSALEANSLDPGSLWIEITESALADPRELDYVLNCLASAGIMLAIDDFGTGWSSLARVADFPWNLLKIDRSFVVGLGITSQAEEVVGATIAMGHAMGMSVLAEGVETAAQALLLESLGCDLAQGYYFGRPGLLPEVTSRIGADGRWGPLTLPVAVST